MACPRRGPPRPAVAGIGSPSDDIEFEVTGLMSSNGVTITADRPVRERRCACPGNALVARWVSGMVPESPQILDLRAAQARPKCGPRQSSTDLLSAYLR